MATSVDGRPRSGLLASPAVGVRSRAWRIVQTGAVMTLVGFAGVMTLSVLNLRCEVSDLKARLWASDANVLRLEQQLDRVFQTQSQQWRRGAPLRDDDLTQLRIWFTFDTAFVGRNGRDGRMTCELAMAHQRAGQCALLLGDCARSIDHTQEARRLYEGLVSTHPGAVDYRADAAFTNALLGEAFEEAGEPHNAARAYEEAIAVLGAPQFPRTADDERLLSEWLARLDALRARKSSGRRP